MRNKGTYGYNDNYEISWAAKINKGNYPSFHTGEHCEHKVIGGKHILVIGTTGSGKTYYIANLLYQYSDAYIFVNSSQEEEVSRVCQIAVSDPEQIFNAFEEGYRRVEFIPDIDPERAIEQLTEIRLWAFRIGLNTNLSEGSFWLTVAIDELQDYTPKRKSTDVNNYFRRGRHHKVRVIGITLMPQDVSTTALAQTENQVIFISGNFQKPYFKGHGIPYETYEPWLKKPYHYVVLNQKGEVSYCLPIR